MKKQLYRAALPLGVPALLFLCCLLSLRLGSTHLDRASFFGGLFWRSGYATESVILYSIRLPRMLAATFAGAGLALSGTLLQKATDNALAAPNILGINAGAGFFVILTLACFPRAFALLPVAALLGAMLAAVLILGVAGRLGLSRTTVVLAGVALSALFSAGISFCSVLDAEALVSYTDFSIGGLRGVTMRDLYVPIPMILACFAGALFLARQLKLFCLGDTLAASLGVCVRRVRLAALLLAATAAAAAVSFAGLIGFVGLIVPHVARRLVKSNTEKELWLSPALGAILLLLSDLAGRLLFSPTEVPVGIFTALLGVPFFLSLLARRAHHA